jgi:hypothetical protein
MPRTLTGIQVKNQGCDNTCFITHTLSSSLKGSTPPGDCLPNNFELEVNLNRSGKQSLAGLFPTMAANITS